jgi:hypothetical protein
MPLQKSSMNTTDMRVRSVGVLHVGLAKVGGTCWQWCSCWWGLATPMLMVRVRADALDEFSCGLHCYAKIGWATPSVGMMGQHRTCLCLVGRLASGMRSYALLRWI